MADILELLEDHSQKLLQFLELSGEVRVEQEDDHYLVDFDIDETGLMIGYHGETLDALRLVLSNLVYVQTDTWPRMTVNVGDYQQEREEQLQRMADGYIDEVIETGESVTLPYLNARERRIVHMYIQGINEVTSESVGEDEQRRLVVFPA